MAIQRALLSVSDKTGIVEFARSLANSGIELLSTGGTFRTLKDAGLAVTEVKDVTGFPEIMDGRVKTLHPKIHGGLLADRDVPGHISAMQEHGIQPIDMLVVNLYPFRETVSRGAGFDECIENIDIGGPAMIRAAAKNHKHVLVITDAGDYEKVLTEVQSGNMTPELRRELASKAYAHTAAYDAAIAGWFHDLLGGSAPTEISFAGKLVSALRYGENPHQAAALYATGEQRPGVVTAQQLQGKELSYNNINDTDAAYELVAEFQRPAVAIIKHANPCGVAEGENLLEAYQLALRCDPISAFGGIIAVNRELDGKTAEHIAKLFAEVVIAPSISNEAKEILTSKKNLRVLVAGAIPNVSAGGKWVKSVAGGLLVQSRDNGTADIEKLKCVTKRLPTAEELRDMQFAWRVAKHVKSNAIVYAKDCATVGVGAGQMSRVDFARIAAHKAEDAAIAANLGDDSLAIGSVVASDAFFPFPDGLLTAISAGATAVVQPGGSMRDADVIAAADEAGITMLFTGMRHFRH